MMPFLMLGSRELTKIWIILVDISSALVGMLTNSSKLFVFSNKAQLSSSGVRLLLELYCVRVIKHVAFFPDICEKLPETMAMTFTFTSTWM